MLLFKLLIHIFPHVSLASHLLIEEIDKAAKILEVPGAAIGVVNSDGQVLFSHCLGYLRQGESDSMVNDRSFFRIGSITKSFTSLMIAGLVERGTLSWDDNLQDLLPTLKLSDKIDEPVTLREALGMSTGIPTKGLLLLLSQADTGEDRIDELRLIEPTAPKHSKFQYSNHMFAAAGYAAAHKYAPDLPLDEAYEKAIRDLVFENIGFKHSSVNGRRFSSDNICYPHAVGSTGKVLPLSHEDEYMLDTIQPSGSIVTNLEDMLRYVQYELNTKSVSELERLKKHISVSEGLDYGLGVVVRNHPVFGEMYGHRGGSIGFSTSALFSKSLGLGVVSLTNKVESSDFTNIVEDLLFEFFSAGSFAEVTEKVDIYSKKRNDLSSVLLKEGAITRSIELPINQCYYNKMLGSAVLQFNGYSWSISIGRIKCELKQIKNSNNQIRFRLTDNWACMQEIYVAVENERLILSDLHDKYEFHAL